MKEGAFRKVEAIITREAGGRLHTKTSSDLDPSDVHFQQVLLAIATVVLLGVSDGKCRCRRCVARSKAANAALEALEAVSAFQDVAAPSNQGSVLQ